MPEDLCGKGQIVLITGGAGFIGSNLALKLASEGYRIRIIDNLSTGDIRNIEGLSEEAEFFKGRRNGSGYGDKSNQEDRCHFSSGCSPLG